MMLNGNRYRAGRSWMAWIWIALTFSSLETGTVAAAETDNLRVGAAFRDINPNPLLPVSGGIGPSNPVREKKGDLTVRAIVLRQGEVSMAIASIDLLGFPAPLIDKVRAKVEGIDPGHILMGATHTHCAPDPYGFPDGNGGTAADLDCLDWGAFRRYEYISATSLGEMTGSILVDGAVELIQSQD